MEINFVKTFNVGHYRLPLVFILLALLTCKLEGQDEVDDAFFIKSVYEKALEKQISYTWLEYLSERIGGRIAGSPQSLAAVEFTAQIMDTIGTDTVWRQACEVNYWYRGEKEAVSLINHPVYGTRALRCLALGGSGATPAQGITAEVVAFKTLDELRNYKGTVKGKIVYFNRPFENKHLRTFHGYGGSVDQRVFGPALAAKHGAVACVIRSMTGRLDDWPHTGVTLFNDSSQVIPALALSTKAAELLDQCLLSGPTRLYVKTSCEDRGPQTSYSVIGEIRGSKFPDEIILVGGHLDSWDVGGGAHDDGAGCIHSMEVLYLLKQMNYKPRRTIRAVMFQNEENGLAGGRTYAAESNARGEFHLAAIESDAGGFTPLGFNFDADTAVLVKYSRNFTRWEELLSPYNLHFNKGGSGADIGPLKSQRGMLFGLSPDSQRYFDYHHTEQDHIQAVHPRELALGSAAMASLVYLIDRYGLE